MKLGIAIVILVCGLLLASGAKLLAVIVLAAIMGLLLKMNQVTWRHALERRRRLLPPDKRGLI